MNPYWLKLNCVGQQNRVQGGPEGQQPIAGLSLVEALSFVEALSPVAALSPGSRMIDRTQPSAAAGTGLSRDLESRRSAGLAAVVCLVLAGLFVQPAFAKEPSTNMLFKQGQAAEAKQDYDAAFDYFQKAAAKAPFLDRNGLNGGWGETRKADGTVIKQ